MDTRTTYLGLNLKHPLVASASPLTREEDNFKRLEDGGAAAIVMHSLFEEQLTQESLHVDQFLSYGAESFGEALSYFPEAESYSVGPDEYLELIRNAKRSLEIPVIGSLNGVSDGGWVDYARQIEQAGADALELNIYYIPTDPDMDGATVEEMYINVVEHVNQSVNIPIAVKLSPFFSSTANMAKKLKAAGANGLVLFNRFYQPDFDLDSLEVVPHLILSNANEMRLPLRWVAILFGRVDVDFAITSGVHTFEDALKGLMAGANVMMMTSEILKRGFNRFGDMNEAMSFWMEERGYESVAQMRGSMSQQHIGQPAAFERANYMKVLQSWRQDPTGRLAF